MDENDQEQENDSNSNTDAVLHSTGDVDLVQTDSNAMSDQITMTSDLLTVISVSTRRYLSI